MRQLVSRFLPALVSGQGALPCAKARRTAFLLFSFLPCIALGAGARLRAQIPDRITQKVDSGQAQILPNHHPFWASPANDAGLAPANQEMGQLTLVLARSPEQEQALEQLIVDQQNPGSPAFHQWLTPAQVGERFGLSQSDIDTVTGWLQAQGLRVTWISPSRTFIGFSGTTADVEQAFGTEIHSYVVNGEQRFSVASDPMIPPALAPVIKAVRGLYTIEDRPLHHVTAVQSSAPQDTTSGGGHYIGPADFNTIYDVPLSLTGAGATIGIVGEARTDFTDFDNFRSHTGATFANPTEVVPTAFGGNDPGPAYTSPPGSGVSIGNQSEATLDVLRAGSVAPGARLLLVVANTSGKSDGIATDAQYLVQTTPVPANIMTISFGECESEAGSSSVNFWNQLFQQAASEGISVLVSSGDSGASGCDTAFTTPPTTLVANSPNSICSSSYATCVGGTEFNDTSNPSTYWNSSNGTGLLSALSYIPEGGWNEPGGSGATQVAASGGGVSAFVATPSWQTGTGVPGTRAGRYTPDISFSSSCHDGYFACLAAAGASCVVGSGGSFAFVGYCGTSAAAPGMAGVAALLDQKLGIAQGNLNPEIYQEAAAAPQAFHDVTVASSGVSSCSLNTASMCNNSAPSPTSLTGGEAGFLVTAGFDEVTGLGSLDVQEFLNNYAATSTGSTVTPTVTVTPSASQIATTQALTVTISVAAVSGDPTPTGGVTLSSGSYSSVATILANGGASITVAAGALATGTDTLTATYTPDSNSSSIYNSATGSAAVTVTVAAFTLNGSSASFAPGATSGDTSTITVMPSGGFTGAVALTAAVTSSPAGAQDLPTLSFGSTGTVNITGNSVGTATLTIATTGSTTGALDQHAYPSFRKFGAGEAALACILFLCVPIRKRRWRNLLGLVLLAIMAAGVSACNGSSSSTGNNSPSVGGTTAGTYIVTVTGTSGTLTTTAAIDLIVQ